MTWEVIAVEKQSIDLKVAFEQPIQVSQQNQPDRFKVQVNLDFFVDEDFQVLEKQTLEVDIPRQLSDKEADAIGASG